MKTIKRILKIAFKTILVIIIIIIIVGSILLRIEYKKIAYGNCMEGCGFRVKYGIVFGDSQASDSCRNICVKKYK